MRLAELVNQHYDELNENDFLIWRYIQAHKKQCCDISIDELAGICAISRATISRFTQKLSFQGFREFKIRLQMEVEAEQVQNEVLLDEVCSNYMKVIQNIQDTDMSELCAHIYKAKRLFVFGTGEVQNAAAQMIKRMFMNANRFFVTLSGKSELTMAIENISEEDLMIIISLSGETQLAVDAARRLSTKGTYLISITQLSNNTVARLSDKSLYISTNQLLSIGDASLETCSSYFNVAELLCVKYLMYIKNQSAEM